jgi:hypothetical protein
MTFARPILRDGSDSRKKADRKLITEMGFTVGIAVYTLSSHSKNKNIQIYDITRQNL